MEYDEEHKACNIPSLGQRLKEVRKQRMRPHSVHEETENADQPRRIGANTEIPTGRGVMGKLRPVITHDCIKKMPLFQQCDPRFVEEIIMNVAVEMFVAGSDIVVEDTEGSSMYIINRGTVDVMVKGERVAVLNDGAYFGEVSLLGVFPKRMATIRAQTFVDVRVLNRESFVQILEHYPYERMFFENEAIRRLLESKAMRSGKDDADLRRLEEKQRKLQRVLDRGRAAVRPTQRNDEPQVGDERLEVAREAWRQVKLYKEDPPNKGGQSLAEWRNNLVSSNGAKRLDILAVPGLSSSTRWSSIIRTGKQLNVSPRGSMSCSLGGPTPDLKCHQRVESQRGFWKRSIDEEEPQGFVESVSVWENDYVSGAELHPNEGLPTQLSRSPLRMPYPSIPSVPPHDPSCVRSPSSVGRSHTAQGYSSGTGTRAVSVDMRAASVDISLPRHVGATYTEPLRTTSVCSHARSHSVSGEAPRPQTAMSCFCDGPAEGFASPGIGEAVRTLSRCFLRPQWHCEQQAAQKQELAGGQYSPGPQTHIAEEDIDEMGATTPTPHGPLNGILVEVVLRGSFYEATNMGPVAEGDDGEESPSSFGKPKEEEEPPETPEPTSPPSAGISRDSQHEASTDSRSQELDADDCVREQAGFGKFERGSIPSGRVSIPGMRSGRSECASQPNPVESIEIGTIEKGFRDQVEHILGWRLLEAPETSDGRRSPPPMRFSPFAGADTVPPPSELAAEVTLPVSCRLLKHRSGSSSVVLELSLGHHEGCVGPTCSYRPNHQEALNWLLAHFSRHASLRLVPQKPAVKVQLEPLSGACTPQHSWSAHNSFEMSEMDEIDEMDENLEFSKEPQELAPVPEAGPVEEQGRDRQWWEDAEERAVDRESLRDPMRMKIPAGRRRSPRTGSPPTSQRRVERGDELFEAVRASAENRGGWISGRGYGRAMLYTPTYFTPSARSTPTPQQRKRRAPLVAESFSHKSSGSLTKTTRSKSTSAWLGSRT